MGNRRKRVAASRPSNRASQVIQPEHSLGTMPVELILAAAELLSMEDLKSLSLTCRAIRGIVGKILWQTLVVRPMTWNRIESIPTAVPSEIPSRMVRHLHFRADDEALLDPRCIHWNPCPQRTGYSKFKLEPTLCWPRFEKLSESAVTIIGRFRRGQLRSFSWDMGACVPHGVMHQLTATQSQITSLRLMTDSRCDRWPAQNSMFVEKLRTLDDFCWIGPPDLVTLAKLLGPRAVRVGDPNSPRQACGMLSLELDWTTNDLYLRAKQRLQGGVGRHVWMDPHARPSGPVGRAPGPSFDMPCLQYICLTRVPIALDSFSGILHLQTLQELTIRDCTRWTQAMAHAAQQERPARFTLHTLEIKGSGDGWINDSHSNGGQDQFKWLEFLDFIDNVEELYLSIEVTSASAICKFWEPFERLGNMASKHVLHYRENSHEDWFDDPLDINDMGTTDGQSRLVHRPFRESSAESLGICCEAPYLKETLKPFTRKETLRFLHIRQTSRDLDEKGSWGIRRQPSHSAGRDVSCVQILEKSFFEFAQWVFGPHGILSLEVLAFGDFGDDAVVENHNFLLFRCKGSKTRFRFVGVEDEVGARVISEHHRLLEACPTVPSMLSSGELRSEYEQEGLRLGPTSNEGYQVDEPFWGNFSPVDNESDDYDPEQDGDKSGSGESRDDGNESGQAEQHEEGTPAGEPTNQDDCETGSEGSEPGDNEPGHEKANEGSNAPEGQPEEPEAV